MPPSSAACPKKWLWCWMRPISTLSSRNNGLMSSP
ncbi:hypothetical protein H206_05497 [Candidatus Electrothrix aarhusensis]|uniref:Uncharacterized protein n=1 Tax=Candidatus Electrothrix aarhusensis TaxID=1859131 RepID=A0A444J489_9BACT|nr:hypothetical protein H206_05497 [Candidatus Electrothrix aarhusensis]